MSDFNCNFPTFLARNCEIETQLLKSLQLVQSWVPRVKDPVKLVQLSCQLTNHQMLFLTLELRLPSLFCDLQKLRFEA